MQAFQNSVNIAMCNRAGLEDGMDFSGESIVCDYEGDILSLAGADEELLIAEVNMQGASDTRRRKPYVQLRRTDLYE